MSVSSIQLPTERALQQFLKASGVIDALYVILCAHDIEVLPNEGCYVAIIAGPGNFEELIDNATSRVEFRVATQVAETGQRINTTAQHQAVVGALHDLLSWQNFDDVLDVNGNVVTPGALSTLNSQQTNTNGITIGFSGWEQTEPPLDTHTDAQIISTLPYDFDVFVASAES
jgi:hypothetical protein